MSYDNNSIYIVHIRYYAIYYVRYKLPTNKSDILCFIELQLLKHFFYFWDYNMISFTASLSSLNSRWHPYLFFSNFYLLYVYLSYIWKHGSTISSACIMLLLCMILRLTIWYWIRNLCDLPWERLFLWLSEFFICL